MKSAEELRTALRCCHEVEGYSCGDQCPYWGTCKMDNPGKPLVSDLETILNLHIPMRPSRKEEEGLWPSCPNCGHWFHPGSEPEHCFKCGQEMNWK